MKDRLYILIRGIVRVTFLYFSSIPSIWIILNPLLYIMFAPLGIHFVMTLPWPFLNSVLDPYGRGITLHFLTYKYVAWINNGWSTSFWSIIETVLILSGVSLFLWSFALWLKSRGKLITCGPYRVIRYPQYFGIIFTILGLSLQTARPIALISWGTMTYAYVLMAFFEERSLTNKFGEEYLNYKAKTWFMLPFPRVLTRKFTSVGTVITATFGLIIYVMLIIYVSYYCVFSLRGVAF